MDQFGIGEAVARLREGRSVTRTGWNGPHRLHLQKPDVNSKMTLPYVYIQTAGGALVPWLCSQSDLLGVDWYEVDQ
ncbi:MAG: DUF2829 domain-containing protein [Anaerolineales bacterium]|nr:DUF2829 domain-containing protein [Anaerolineales bacterium]